MWDILNKKVREHEAKLDEAGDLQRFLRDLDHFQAWLTATQRQVGYDSSAVYAIYFVPQIMSPRVVQS